METATLRTAASRRWSLWRPVLGALLGTLAVLLVEREVGWIELFARWGAVEPWLLTAVVCTQGLSYLARAARLLRVDARLPPAALWPCLELVLVHNALNLLLPMRAGELSFPVLMQRRFGTDPWRAAGMLLWLRLADVQVLVVLAGLAAASVSHTRGSEALRLSFALAMVAALAVPAALFWFAARQRRNAAMPTPHLPARAARLVAAIPTSGRVYVEGFAWTWLCWGLKLSGLALLFASLSGAGLADGALAAMGGDASSVLPLPAPAGLGSYEAGVMLATLNSSTPMDARLAAAVNLHVFTLAVALGALLASLCRPGRRVARNAIGTQSL